MSNNLLGEAFSKAEKRLEEAGIDDARNNVMELAGHVLGVSRTKLTTMSKMRADEVFGDEEAAAFEKLMLLRIDRQPLQYLLGEAEFMGLTFSVTPAVLIPRQDTEILVERVLEYARVKLSAEDKCSLRILDVCTGSGCIAISLAHYLDEYLRKNNLCEDHGFSIVAVDISSAALTIATENIVANHVEQYVSIIQSDMFTQLDTKLRNQAEIKSQTNSLTIVHPKENNEGHTKGHSQSCTEQCADKVLDNQISKFDIILSNPPYIACDDCKHLQAEVMREPQLALDGGKDGLDFYRELLDAKGKYLAPNGAMFFEFGYDQEELLRALVCDKLGSNTEVCVFNDYAGIPRVMRIK